MSTTSKTVSNAVSNAVSNTVSKTVSFRLTPDHYALLEIQANTTGISPGEVARARLIETFTAGSSLKDFEQRLEKIIGQLTDLRHDVPLVTQALLISTNAVRPDPSFTSAMAETWVRENLRSTR